MPEQLKSLLIITSVVLALFLFWAITIGITYWDISRRKLPDGGNTTWMVVVVLLPGVGFLAYLISRLVANYLSPVSQPAQGTRRRRTLLKPQPEPELDTGGTILAADLDKLAMAEAKPLDQASAGRAPKVVHYSLVIVDGPYDGREFTLSSLPVKIGRGPQADIRLDDDHAVSRQHAELYDWSGVLRIRDLKSTHGTRVNDFNIDDQSLNPGDRIQVGLTTLVVGVTEERK